MVILTFRVEQMLRIESLHFAYNQKTAFSFPDFELDAGQNLLILGESGIGKTTLLHLIAGLLRPDSGSVTLMDTVLHELTTAKMDRFRGKHIGLVFQRPQFVNALSLSENLALVQYLTGNLQNKERIHGVADSLGIGQKLNEKPQRLSQGEQQRAAIALAVINEPQLILADEPTSSLDDKNCEKVVTLLQEQATATRAHLVIITHDYRLRQHFQRTLSL